MWDFQLVALGQLLPTGPPCDCELLGLHQLLQTLQHHHAQGLEPGGEAAKRAHSGWRHAGQRKGQHRHVGQETQGP